MMYDGNGVGTSKIDVSDINIEEVKTSIQKVPKLNEIDNIYQEKISEFQKNPITKRNLIFGAGILGLGTLSIMFASQIISGTIALVGIGITAVGGYYGYKYLKMYDPVFRKKLANQQIKLLIQEAQTRKIETLENYALNLKKYIEYVEYMKKKTKAKLMKYEDKLAREKNQDLKVQYESLKKQVQKAYDSIVTISEKMKSQDEKLQIELKILREKQEFIKDMKDVMSFLEDTSGRYLDEMLAIQSTNAIETEFNEILASLENISEEG